MSRSYRQLSDEQLAYQRFLRQQVIANNVPCRQAEQWLTQNFPDWRERVDSDYKWECFGIDGVTDSFVGAFSSVESRMIQYRQSGERGI